MVIKTHSKASAQSSSTAPRDARSRPSTAAHRVSATVPSTFLPPFASSRSSDAELNFATDASRLALFELGGVWLECERRAHLLKAVCEDYRAAIDFLIEDMAPDGDGAAIDSPMPAPQAAQAQAQSAVASNSTAPPTPQTASMDPLDTILKLAREIRAADPNVLVCSKLMIPRQASCHVENTPLPSSSIHRSPHPRCSTTPRLSFSGNCAT